MSKLMKNLIPEQLLEQTEYKAFYKKLEQRFDPDTAQKVCDFFEQMDLPIPVRREEFMQGTDGELVFAEDYGCVIRVEHQENNMKRGTVDHPLMIQPLGSVEINNAVVEIVPGTDTTTREKQSRYVGKSFQKQGYHFWDDKPSNVGILPQYSVSFPFGVPVSIDRGSVNQVFGAAAKFKGIVKFNSDRHTRAAAKAQKQLYGAIQASFDAAVTQNPQTKDIIVNKVAVKEFWDMCKQGVADKKLIAGWKRGKMPIGADGVRWKKEDRAVVISSHYKKRLDGMKK